VQSDPFDAPFASLKACSPTTALPETSSGQEVQAGQAGPLGGCLKKAISKVSEDALGACENDYRVAWHSACFHPFSYSPGYPRLKICTRISISYGKGTPAPWDPPKRLVIQGPYRYIRNPMITGALLMLLAESILFLSLPIATWMTVFFIGNAIYFPLIEEKGLEKRFGDEYRNYKANVPRWLPRIRPWKQIG
jgi:hypothetical protein